MSSTQRINPYGKICTEIYELDKPAGSLPDVPFYLERLSAVSGPILEAAIGTGRLAIPLMEAGHEVVGFDASADMLAQCRRNCAARGLRPELAQARFQDFAYDRAFGAIVVPVSTFTFVDDFAEALAVLKRFREHLAPGGLLMVDLPVLGRFWDGEGVRSWTAANGDLLTLTMRKVEQDALRQRRVAHHRYERWRDGRLVETELEVMAGREWGLKEFELALMAAGFSQVSVHGNYDRTRAPRRSDRGLTFEALIS